MKQFEGGHLHKLDAKSKLSLPKAFRDLLPDQVILTKGLYNNILVMSPEGWELFTSKMRNKSPQLRNFFRSNRFPCEIDKVGRILIPQILRIYAKIENGEVSVCGVGNWIEIWERQRKETHDDEVRNAAKSLEDWDVISTEINEDNEDLFQETDEAS